MNSLSNWDGLMEKLTVLADSAKFDVACTSSGLELDEIVLEKVRRNNEKYPVEKAFGSKDKYTELK